jgi:hypothetical protein
MQVVSKIEIACLLVLCNGYICVHLRVVGKFDETSKFVANINLDIDGYTSQHILGN